MEESLFDLDGNLTEYNTYDRSPELRLPQQPLPDWPEESEVGSFDFKLKSEKEIKQEEIYADNTGCKHVRRHN